MTISPGRGVLFNGATSPQPLARGVEHVASRGFVYVAAEVSLLETKDAGQQGRPYVTPRPGLMTRVFFRLPVYMYRIHLGWLFDHRVLYLVHRGRKTGKIHKNCIEVIHFDPVRNESFVISAYGRRANWFRNIMKSPPVELQIGREKMTPEFRVLPTDEARQVLKKVFVEHPGEGRFFLKQVFRLTPSETQFEGLADLVPIVAFRPKDGP